MKNKFLQIALIGATASGKSALAIEAAKKHNCIALSLDSLSVYKDIDIASAKPTIEETKGVVHFGINEIYPNEPFDVTLFIKIYKKAITYAKENDKNLIIVGGSSFYLKSLINGISPIPKISQEIKEKTDIFLKDLPYAYNFLCDIDPIYMSKIKPNDTYRIEKTLNIYLQTGIKPSDYFEANPPIPAITENLPIFEIDMPRDILRDRIKQRTKKMLEAGLIEEVKMLEDKYTKTPSPMKAIGIRETLDFLDGKISENELSELISTHTAQLAKRQTTFNRTQFKEKILIKNDDMKAFDKVFNI